MTARSITLVLIIMSAFGTACEGTRVTESVLPGVDRPDPEPSVFTTLEVSPSTVTLDQGSTVQLTIVARDQRRVLIEVPGGLTFSSSNPAIAEVSAGGWVSGVAGGTADILVTKTIGGVTRSVEIKATILQAAPSASLVITADLRRGWQPALAHLIVGGTVTWTTSGPRDWAGLPHRMLYLMDKTYSVVDSLDLSTGSATRKLMTVGEYHYCSGACWDSPDYGAVYVR